MKGNRQSANRYFSLFGRALVAVAFSAACLTLPVAPAFAGDSTISIPSVKVQYVPGMLGQEGYANDLYARLGEAAEQVCGEADIRLDRRQSDVDRCIDKSLERAVADVGAPELREVHENSRQGIVRIAASL